MPGESTMLRLETQLDVVPMLLSGATPKAIISRAASGEWSVHENLAHLARHHAIFLERLHRILAEDAPELGRYRAEEDSNWGEWSRLSTEEVLSRLKTLRLEIVRVIKGLSEAEVSRVGIHPLFGARRSGVAVVGGITSTSAGESDPVHCRGCVKTGTPTVCSAKGL